MGTVYFDVRLGPGFTTGAAKFCCCQTSSMLTPSMDEKVKARTGFFSFFLLLFLCVFSFFLPLVFFSTIFHWRVFLLCRSNFCVFFATCRTQLQKTGLIIIFFARHSYSIVIRRRRLQIVFIQRDNRRISRRCNRPCLVHIHSSKTSRRS